MSGRLERKGDWKKLAAASHYKVEALARQCKVSRRTLLRYFLENFKETPKQWLDKVRADTAAEEILRGELLKSVAADVDCKHPSTLTRLFKRVKGTTPTDYRDKHGDVPNG